ncbi:MAG TPA: hypothetical protein VFM23_10035 [Gemmatimonadales bacterium]|nr:hypothetical protein [Gemmatimonadales bacterium]
MSPLVVQVGAGVLAVLALIALRGKRWAYFAFVLLGLAYFPLQPQFRAQIPKCDLLLPTKQVLLHGLQNYVVVALFAGFCWISWAQFRRARLRSVWAFGTTVVGGALVEVAGSMMKGGHCRLRDLVPAAAGALGMALVLAIWSRLTRKPGYVKLVRPAARAAVAPRPAAPSPRASLPPRAVVYDPPAYAPPPPPADIAPAPVEVAPAEEAEPTVEVRRARTPLSQRLRPVLAALQPVLRRIGPSLQRVWAFIRGRRGALIVGFVVLALVGAGSFAVLRLSAPAPVVEQPPPPPPAEPPPPPRPLQAEVEGYYEPNYKFTVFDRRFTRLTLRPRAFVTFVRTGTRQDVDCENARIDRDAVRLRCTLEPYGVVTIDGRFPTRYATSKLDMPVLSALITVTSARGDVVYRARDSFYWHTPE